MESGIVPEESIMVGKPVLYGAIAGECYFRGVASERFAVRNRAAEILADWQRYRPLFRKVMPVEYRCALAEMAKGKAATVQAAGRAGRPRHPPKAEQSDHGHLAAPEHFAIGIHSTVLLAP
jgi:glutamate synthase domain-containing protein 3